MNARKTSAGLLLLGAAALAAPLFASPAAAGPVCVPGFVTAVSKSWLLECRRTVPVAQKGVALTQAYNANCNTDSYWNFGPKVSAETNRRRGSVTVKYICGHVEK